MCFGWRNLGEQAGRAIGIHTIFILMSRTYMSTLELFVSFSVGFWIFTGICSNMGLPTFFICSWPPTDDVSPLQVLCRCFSYPWVSLMALAASVLLEHPAASNSWIWSQTPQGRRDHKWDFCVWEPQGSCALPQLWVSRNKGQEGSALAVQAVLYTRSVIPSSFHLFPVSSTGADTIMDHAENCVLGIKFVLEWQTSFLPVYERVKGGQSAENTINGHLPCFKESSLLFRGSVKPWRLALKCKL